MQRDLARLSSQRFDIVVVGGGVLGALVAWDAASRGLTTAMVERDDFASGTTTGSGKVAHGGIRSLQHGDLRGARESAREQLILRRLAPALLQPLPFVVPALGSGAAERAMLASGAWAWRRVRHWLAPNDDLPEARFVSSSEAAALAPLVTALAGRGALVFHDYLIRSPERLTLALIHAADAAGAAIANHIEAIRLDTRGGAVTGLTIRDVLGGAELRVSAPVVVNATGPWASRTFAKGTIGGRAMRLAKGVHVVMALPAGPAALALPWPTGVGRRIFLTPWEGRTLLGPASAPFAGDPAHCHPAPAEVAELVEAAGRRWPALGAIGRPLFAYAGLYPMFAAGEATGFTAARHPLVVDHGRRGDGPAGLVTAVSVKLTTARALAERVVDLAVRRLGRPVPPATTGGAGPLRLARPSPLPEVDRVTGATLADAAVLDRMVACAVQHEMALTLADFVLRRTQLLHHGEPGAGLLERIAALMGRALHWTNERVAAELATVRDYTRAVGG